MISRIAQNFNMNIIPLFFTFFYVNRGKYWFRKKNFDLQFLIDLHVFGRSVHDLTTFRKRLSVCVCDKNFVASAARELMNRIS